jgi:hypothetical protein
MTTDTGSPLPTAVSAERRPAVWPWLLLPLAALTLFFALKTAKDSLPAGPVHHAEAPAASAPSDAESH